MIIGAGPAGMTAALYAVSGGLSVSLIEKGICGGQMTMGSLIENYPGIGSVSGLELSDRMREQIESAGIAVTHRAAERIVRAEDHFIIEQDGESESARSVIIANGALRRRLGCLGENEFIGKGVSYCAVCDGVFFRERNVVVVGGGSSAVGMAIYLAGICKSVKIIFRAKLLREGEAARKRISVYENISLLPESELVEICGDTRVRKIKVSSAGEKAELETDGVFIAVGSEACNEWLRSTIELTEDGYIRSDHSCRTSAEGIFAAGDTREGAVRQIITAAADGAVSALGAISYVRSQRRSAGNSMPF